MNHFKIGDKLLCKLDVETTSHKYFTENNYYVIHRIIINSSGDYWYYFYTDYESLYPFSEHDGDMYDVFYTRSEIRKMKLKNIEKHESDY